MFIYRNDVSFRNIVRNVVIHYGVSFRNVHRNGNTTEMYVTLPYILFFLKYFNITCCFDI